jgi:alanine dehydrogenase
MRIGCPKEIKNREYRVGLTPESAKELVRHGHEVWIETGAGLGIGASDIEYQAAGAHIRPNAAALFADCEMIVKVNVSDNWSIKIYFINYKFMI